MFYAKTFIFDGIPSEFYDLYIGQFGGDGESTSDGSNDVDLLTEKLFRRPRPLFFGAEQTPVLEFPLSAYFKKEVSASKYSHVAGWLFGQQEYKVLRVCQNDMQSTFFNCFFTEPSITRIGNMIQGFETKVVCDAPWGWGEPVDYSYSFTDINVSTKVTIYNGSDNAFYTYPTSLIINGNAFGGQIAIVNETDNNRQFLYTTLLPYEQLVLNCDLQFISSSLTTYPLVNFNKQWLRLLRGKNTLAITGNVSSISMTLPMAVKVA